MEQSGAPNPRSRHCRDCYLHQVLTICILQSEKNEPRAHTSSCISWSSPTPWSTVRRQAITWNGTVHWGSCPRIAHILITSNCTGIHCFAISADGRPQVTTFLFWSAAPPQYVISNVYIFIKTGDTHTKKKEKVRSPKVQSLSDVTRAVFFLFRGGFGLAASSSWGRGDSVDENIITYYMQSGRGNLNG